MTAGVSFAGHHEERYVREEAGRRNMKLITQDEAKSIAAKRIGRDDVRFHEVELDDDGRRGGFFPVYEIEARADD